MFFYLSGSTEPVWKKVIEACPCQASSVGYSKLVIPLYLAFFNSTHCDSALR